MVQLEELKRIVKQIQELKGLFRQSANLGLFLDTQHRGRFVGLITDARILINEAFTPNNDYTKQLILTVNNGSGGYLGGPSFACVTEVEHLLKSAIRTLKRREHLQAVELPNPMKRPSYVELSRLLEMRGIQSPTWDFSKLVQLCSELNIASEHDCHHSVAMLVRAIMDHVPPVFGLRSFGEVASNYAGGGSSFKKSMEQLQKTLRNIADGHLHTLIRSKESLPTASQVDFRAPLDQLLAEIIRIS